MINLTVNDATQKAILPHLKVTEELIARAISDMTARQGNAEITAMPDLGIASNSVRMRGGFFTGMYVRWESPVPFVPVDATINSCGVYVFTLKKTVDKDSFVQMLTTAKSRISSLGYNWNFERGNHFITLGMLDGNIPCVVIHASADEFKKSRVDSALYPTNDIWYKDDIKIFQTSTENTGRFLRYISGNTAERFINIASSIESFNKQRMQDVAHLIFGSLFDEEYLFISHYGMPSPSSVAIGCSWTNSKFVLLTAPNKDIFIADTTVVESDFDLPPLNPHGFGVELSNPSIRYVGGNLMVNSNYIDSDDAVARLPKRSIRMQNATANEIERYAHDVLARCNGKIQRVIKPTISLNGVGLI